MNAAERKKLKRTAESLVVWKSKAIKRNKDIRRLNLKVMKLEKSRNRWKGKAQRRQVDIRALKQRIGRLIKSRDRWKTKFVKMKKTEDTQKDVDTLPTELIRKNHIDQKNHLILLSLNLVFACSVSYRSVPKILSCLNQTSGFFEGFKIPHYTTIIRWACRLGYYFLKRPNKRHFSERNPWICITDHTIQVGTNKAMAVLGVPLKAMQLGRALTLKDVTVLDVVVKKSWTGEEVKKSLGKVFKKNAPPIQIVIDGASNLNKGVRDIIEEMNADCHVTYDITHLIAKLMKNKYDGSMKFLSIMKKLSLASKQIAQTDIGYLAPPKLREKARFLNLPKLAVWFEMVRNLPQSNECKRAEIKLLKKYFAWIYKPKQEAYIRQFCTDVINLKDTQKILKNTGINDFSYKEACKKLSKISDNAVTAPIIEALIQASKFSKKISVPALLTSDLIESLFARFKAFTKPHKLFEINKSVLLIPCLCEKITLKVVEKVFAKTTNKETEKWIKRKIPGTLFSRRIKIAKAMKKNQAKNKDEEIVELHPYQKSDDSNEVIWAI